MRLPDRPAAICRALLCVALCIGCWQGPQRVAAEEAQIDVLQREFTTQVQPLLKQFCFDCHAGDSPEGELRLDTFHHASDIATVGRKTWQKVRGRVSGHLMPPKDAEQPSAEQRKLIARWIGRAVASHDCSGPVDPGHETIRRLNRNEYKNTIRDLIGIEVKLADDFPADDVGYGFDNIGDVLTLSPLLMEKYLTAAEDIAERAIITNPLEATSRQTLLATDMRGDGGGVHDRGGGKIMTTTGRIHGLIDVPATGDYVIKVHAYGDQAGDEPPRMPLQVDGREVAEFDVKATKVEPGSYEKKVRIERGQRRLLVAFVNDYYQPSHSNPERRDRNLIVHRIEVLGPVNDEGGLEYPQPHRQIFIATPGGDISEEQAARRVLTRLASRAFRRPARAEEIDRLLPLYQAGKDEGGNFESGIQLALVGVLVSPNFLFKVEEQPSGDEVRTLNEFELATRLSYFLWSSMPDDELFELARQGRLREELEPQVRRMLRDDKAAALTENFAMQWLQLRSLEEMEPDRRRFPNWNTVLRDDMLTETRLFIDAIIKEDRSVLDLIDADFTFLNERLARHYDIGGIRGDRFQRVGVELTKRGGVLSHASVLTVTSDPTRTSPVKRGKWILDNILGTPPPDPPPDAPELEESPEEDASASLRERFEQHRENVRCAACHQQMDPLGFALENFDGIGKWRDRDGRFEIDASGQLPDGQKFDGPAELKKVLVVGRREAFLRCLSEKLLTYALGRGVEYYDQCTVDAIVKRTTEDRFRFSRMVVEIVKSDAFGKQRAK